MTHTGEEVRLWEGVWAVSFCFRSPPDCWVLLAPAGVASVMWGGGERGFPAAG